MRRDCPRDFSPLVQETRKAWLREVAIDVCPKCAGIFLDEGEIRKLTGNRALHVLLTKKLGIDSDSTLVCPRCGGIMDLEDAAGVPVDACLSCHGIWLDAGELEALSEKEEREFREVAGSDAKLAELFDEKMAKRRGAARGTFLNGLFRGLSRRR